MLAVLGRDNALKRLEASKETGASVREAMDRMGRRAIRRTESAQWPANTYEEARFLQGSSECEVRGWSGRSSVSEQASRV